MRYSLVADGSSDRVLVPILNWCHRQCSNSPADIQWVDSTRIPLRSRRDLAAVVDLYPCEILFIHRDAEAQPALDRRVEIASLAGVVNVPYVPVIPIRMTEAWLLFDEQAIRSAVGNPNGTVDLRLPAAVALEDLPDPKQVLHTALTTASELNRRRRSSFRPHERVQQIPNYIEDFSPLRALSAFRRLESDLALCLNRPS
jgi:hypothetical protein